MDEQRVERSSQQPRRLEREIGAHREEVLEMVGELEQRWKERWRPRALLRRFPQRWGSRAGLFALAAGGLFALFMRRRRFAVKGLRALPASFSYGARRAAAKQLPPEAWLRREPSARRRALRAAGTASATALARMAAKQAGRRLFR